MATANNPNLLEVDWSTIPAPVDDGQAAHLTGTAMPHVSLASTRGGAVDLGALKGTTIVYAYPRTGRPGQIAIVDDWDSIPGARGCTPQSCAFRDHYAALEVAGATRVFGLSTQDTEYQREAVERLNLPFPILSDEKLELARALRLPTMTVAGTAMLKRLAMVIDNGIIAKVFYPVFPPDRNAGDVLHWLSERKRSRS
jgi:peroxiredoxin